MAKQDRHSRGPRPGGVRHADGLRRRGHRRDRQTPPVASDGVSSGVRNAAYTPGLRPEVAWGITSDHFWITVSYADIVSGAIWAAVQACQTRLPGWLCTSAGNLLVSWAQGWGSASNHGVWA